MLSIVSLGALVAVVVLLNEGTQMMAREVSAGSQYYGVLVPTAPVPFVLFETPAPHRTTPKPTVRLHRVCAFVHSCQNNLHDGANTHTSHCKV